MGFRPQDLDMADVWAIEDLTGQTMETFITSGSAKIPYLLAWRQDIHNGRPGISFDQWRVENAHLTIEQVATQLGLDQGADVAAAFATGEDETEDPTNGGGQWPSPGSATAGG